MFFRQQFLPLLAHEYVRLIKGRRGYGIAYGPLEKVLEIRSRRRDVTWTPCYTALVYIFFLEHCSNVWGPIAWLNGQRADRETYPSRKSWARVTFGPTSEIQCSLPHLSGHFRNIVIWAYLEPTGRIFYFWVLLPLWNRSFCDFLIWLCMGFTYHWANGTVQLELEQFEHGIAINLWLVLSLGLSHHLFGTSIPQVRMPRTRLYRGLPKS